MPDCLIKAAELLILLWLIYSYSAEWLAKLVAFGTHQQESAAYHYRARYSKAVTIQGEGLCALRSS